MNHYEIKSALALIIVCMAVLSLLTDSNLARLAMIVAACFSVVMAATDVLKNRQSPPQPENKP